MTGPNRVSLYPGFPIISRCPVFFLSSIESVKADYLAKNAIFACPEARVAVQRKSSPYHPDIPLFLVFIPFISAFNYYLTYSNIQLGWFLLLTFTIDTTQGYLAWWVVRAIILYFDRKWPYETGGARRIVIQFFVTTLTGLLIISLTTELVSLIAKGEPAPLSFYLIDLFIIAIWFFVINGIYIGLYYYQKWKQSEEKREEENRIKAGGLMVRQGRQDLMVSFDELMGLFVDGDYVVASNLAGQKFYLNESLDKVERKLPQLYFFRLNRQYIVHRQLVMGFKRGENGKIDVMLGGNDNIPPVVPVSRTKAAAFKHWFRPD